MGTFFWNLVGWNLAGWDLVGWNLVGWNLVGWNLVGWDLARWNLAGWNLVVGTWLVGIWLVGTWPAPGQFAISFCNFQFAIPDLSAVYCLLSAVCCLLSAVYCLMSNVCCLMSNVYCLLSTVCGLMSNVCCLLSTVYCLMSNVKECIDLPPVAAELLILSMEPAKPKLSLLGIERSEFVPASPPPRVSPSPCLPLPASHALLPSLANLHFSFCNFQFAIPSSGPESPG
jgi:hypothetical protein